MKIFIILLAIQLCTFYAFAVESSFAVPRTITLTNREGVAVDDLHIIFTNGSVEWDGVSNVFTGDNRKGTDHNFYGGAIANGGSVTLKFTLGSGKIQIKNWWWTTGGNQNQNGTRVGKVKTDDGSDKLSWIGGTATGNGAVNIAIGGLNNTFYPTAGNSTSQTALNFMNFINTNFNPGSIELISLSLVSSSEVFIAGDLLGDTSTELHTNIISQDASQHLNLISYSDISFSLLDENFDYPAGDSLGAHGWIANTGGATNRITVSSSSLYYSGYPLFNVGNSVTLNTNGQDAYKDLLTVSDTGRQNAIYAMFLVNVTSAQRPGDYFLALLPSTSTFFYDGRVFARLVSGNLNFGLTKGNPLDTNTSGIWTTASYSLNTTYLLVLKYAFIPGVNNDEVSLYIFSSGFPATEPSYPDIGPLSFSSTSLDDENIGRVAIRQGTANRAPTVILDGIHLSNSWNFPQYSNLLLGCYIQGMYNSTTDFSVLDAATVYLRSGSSPYGIVDLCTEDLGSGGTGTFFFTAAVNGTNYYLVVRQRNSIETWSNTVAAFTYGSLIYDLSASAASAYGSNEILVDNSPTRYALYSGDCNQDGSVNGVDIINVFNSASSFVTGYVSTDVTGDGIVDVSDLIITYNNSSLFVHLIRP